MRGEQNFPTFVAKVVALCLILSLIDCVDFSARAPLGKKNRGFK